MKKILFLAAILLLLSLTLPPPVLAAEGESVFLPGWFAWLMVIISVGIPVVLGIYLRRNGRL
ncbi:MAG: hypothetical protein R3272_07985 [Candidatus Promineifilaceae bacterium]|nr:hypothetical protein [Candidatus Promineifilaceae bacterium]